MLLIMYFVLFVLCVRGDMPSHDITWDLLLETMADAGQMLMCCIIEAPFTLARPLPHIPWEADHAWTNGDAFDLFESALLHASSFDECKDVADYDIELNNFSGIFTLKRAHAAFVTLL